VEGARCVNLASREGRRVEEWLPDIDGKRYWWHGGESLEGQKRVGAAASVWARKRAPGALRNQKVNAMKSAGERHTAVRLSVRRSRAESNWVAP
jgi:hypothetical protein